MKSSQLLIIVIYLEGRGVALALQSDDNIAGGGGAEVACILHWLIFGGIRYVLVFMKILSEALIY